MHPTNLTCIMKTFEHWTCPHTYPCKHMKSPLTLAVSSSSSLPPILQRCLITSKCPFWLAMSRHEAPSCTGVQFSHKASGLSHASCQHVNVCLDELCTLRRQRQTPSQTPVEYTYGSAAVMGLHLCILHTMYICIFVLRVYAYLYRRVFQYIHVQVRYFVSPCAYANVHACLKRCVLVIYTFILIYLCVYTNT